MDKIFRRFIRLFCYYSNTLEKMIITKKFVALNWPKTGSTFVRLVLKSLYFSREIPGNNRLIRKVNRTLLSTGIYGYREVYYPIIRVPGLDHLTDQHGIWTQIPDKNKMLPVVMAVQNPLDRLVSLFHFRWRDQHIRQVDGRAVGKIFPNYPELNFEEFLSFNRMVSQSRLWGVEPKTQLGPQTIEFIQMVFKNPNEVFSRIDDQYIESGEYKRDLPDVSFLRNDFLRRDLMKFLRSMGYSDDRTKFIEEMPHVLPEHKSTRPRNGDYETYFSEEERSRVFREERFLLAILKDHDIVYQ